MPDDIIEPREQKTSNIGETQAEQPKMNVGTKSAGKPAGFEHRESQQGSREPGTDAAGLSNGIGSGSGSTPTGSAPVGNDSGSSKDPYYCGLIALGWTDSTISALLQATRLSAQAIFAAARAGLSSDQMLAAVRKEDSSSLAILIKSAATGTPGDQCWANNTHLASVCDLPIDWWWPDRTHGQGDNLEASPTDSEPSATLSGRKPDCAQEPIVTMSKLLYGIVIEQIRWDQLLLLDDRGREQRGSTVRCDGRTYAPVPLERSLAEALYLPEASADFGGIQKVIANLCDLFTEHGGVEKDIALRLAAAVLSTWVPECLPGPIIINVVGPPGAESRLLALLVAVCRRALKLADPSMHQLASLPAGCSPTLVLNRPANLRQLLAAAADPGTYFLSRGRIAHVK